MWAGIVEGDDDSMGQDVERLSPTGPISSTLKPSALCVGGRIGVYSLQGQESALLAFIPLLLPLLLFHLGDIPPQKLRNDN